LTEREIDQIEQEIAKEIDVAVELANMSKYPPPGLLKELVFSASNPRSNPP